MTFVDPGNLRTSWLGKRLRELRRGLGINATTAAAHIDRSQSLLSKIENGKTPIGRAELEGLLMLYGVDRAQREALLRLHAQQDVKAWWNVYSEDINEPVIDLAWLESIATEISVYCVTVLDALLQTSRLHPDHRRRDWWRRRCRPTRGSRWWPPAKPCSPAPTRRRTRPSSTRPCCCALSAATRRWPAQLRHLLALGRRDHIDIRVLPLDAGAHASPDSGFRVFRLPSPLAEAAVRRAARWARSWWNRLAVSDVAERYDALRQAALEPGPSAD